MEIGFAYAVGAAIVWGLVYAVDQKILYGISPLALVFISSILTALMVLPFMFFDSEPIKLFLASGRSTMTLVVVSVLLGFLANFLIFTGIKDLNASTASVIEIAYPFFVALFSYILFRSTPNVYFFIGGILIFIGSMIVIKFA